ncbi:IDEAL domain-containing protein [Amycolatopsis sp. NPDC088138]|uniref:IDEAL domain-containing protein n=1 Tax=Amycolatopsis sp. NPDC088138 TaxID=3363938 RepID=UPI00381CB0E9
MDGLTPLEDLEAELAADERQVNRDLSIRRLRARIDRALDVGNEAQFVELCGLLEHYVGSRAPDTP